MCTRFVIFLRFRDLATKDLVGAALLINGFFYCFLDLGLKCSDAFCWVYCYLPILYLQSYQIVDEI